MIDLYHFTCDHGYDGITRDWMLMPNLQPFLGARLVWMTDLAVADRAALGLTSETLLCDRTAHRFVVVDDECTEPWVRWAHRHRIPSDVRDHLDGTPGAKPLRWWVAEQPIPVVRTE